MAIGAIIAAIISLISGITAAQVAGVGTAVGLTALGTGLSVGLTEKGRKEGESFQKQMTEKENNRPRAPVSSARGAGTGSGLRASKKVGSYI